MNGFHKYKSAGAIALLKERLKCFDWIQILVFEAITYDTNG